jgi:hypothetical protein
MKSAFQEMTTQVVVAFQTDFRETKGHTPEKERMDTPPGQREMLSQAKILKGQRGESHQSREATAIMSNFLHLKIAPRNQI